MIEEGVFLIKSIQEQINEAQQQRTIVNKESWFVDYCNNCKNGLSCSFDVPCRHPYYCWHEGEAAEVQASLVKIDEHHRLHGYITAQMLEEYKELRERQAQLVRDGKFKLYQKVMTNEVY